MKNNTCELYRETLAPKADDNSVSAKVEQKHVDAPITSDPAEDAVEMHTGALTEPKASTGPVPVAPTATTDSKSALASHAGEEYQDKTYAEYPIEKIDCDKIAHLRPSNELESEEFENIKGSINSHGLHHPVSLVKDGNGDLSLAAGYRRFMACKQLGHKTISAKIVASSLNEVYLSENIHRKNLDVIVRAEIVNQMVTEILVAHPETTVARKLHIGKSLVSDYKKIASGLSQEARDQFRHKGAGINQLRKIAGIENEQEKQEAMDHYLAKLEGGNNRQDRADNNKNNQHQIDRLIESTLKKIEKIQVDIESIKIALSAEDREMYVDKFQRMKKVADQAISDLQDEDEEIMEEENVETAEQ